MTDGRYRSELDEDDDGFEDCSTGGMRPKYKIPILLRELKEDVIDAICESEQNVLCCAACDFKFGSFDSLKAHTETCSGEPPEGANFYKESQYHTNALILALKEMFETGTSGLNPLMTETRLPFHMEPFADLHGEHDKRIVGLLAVVTCRMCKCQFIHRAKPVPKPDKPKGLFEDIVVYDPYLIRHHIKFCPEYMSNCHQFLDLMKPSVDKVQTHYEKLFECYCAIRSGIYGAGFQTRKNSDPCGWREMETIYEVDESTRENLDESGPSDQFLLAVNRLRSFHIQLHNIEPEFVDFIREEYSERLGEALDKIFYARVTGLSI
ncbi:unnamed protein product [Caenorhabditis sp. 36 PRJEB53466]|nr:unnamed protein product [Caenorhabditis sp. 36 PRJEB53466]